MQKFFVEENQIKNNKIYIQGPDVKHISNVLRLEKKEKIQICEKSTMQNYIVEIEEIQKEEIITTILEKLQTSVESNVEVHLYQGLPKADKMELIIQKTTELGIYKIIPVDMIRCVVKLEEKDLKKKLERWQKIAESAAKQSKRDIIPKIEEKQKIKEIAEKITQYDIFMVAYEEEINTTLKQVLKKLKPKDNYKIAVLVGPEGGIDQKEIQTLKEKGAIILTLGKRILRTETAPIAMVSNILYELES